MSTEIGDGPACGHLDWHIELAGMDSDDPRRAEIEACEHCAEEFAELDFLARATAHALLEEAPVTIDAAILKAASKRQPPRAQWLPWAAAAAAAILVLAGTYAYPDAPSNQLAADPDTLALADETARTEEEVEPAEEYADREEQEDSVEDVRDAQDAEQAEAEERTQPTAPASRRGLERIAAAQRRSQAARPARHARNQPIVVEEGDEPSPAPPGEAEQAQPAVAARAARDEANVLSEHEPATDLAALSHPQPSVNEVPAPSMATSPSSRLLRLARSHRAAGNCGEAVRHYEGLLANFRNAPEVPAALLEAGDCYRRLGRLSRAEGVLQQATRYGRSREQAEMDLQSVRALRRSAEASSRMIGAAVEESVLLAPAASED